MIKKVIYLSLILLGIITILVVITSNTLLDGMDTERIELAIKYSDEFSSMSGQSLVDDEIGFMRYIYSISNYSHWIITGSIIWIASLVTIYNAKRINFRGSGKNE